MKGGEIMESFFENTYVKDKKFYKAVAKYACSINPIFRIFYFLLSIIAITFLTIGAMLQELTLIFDAFILILLALLFTIIRRNSKASSLTRAQNEMSNGEEITITTCFFEDAIEFSTSLGEKIKLFYKNVKVVKTLKEVTFIHTRAGIIYAFKNDAFTKGELLDCLDFLKEKNIRVK